MDEKEAAKHTQLMACLMDPMKPLTELEHAARREIINLRTDALFGRLARKERDYERQRNVELRAELDAAYAELRKQKPVVHAIFDRSVWDRAKRAG